MIFTEDVERFIPPKKGSSHVLRVVRELIYHEPQARGTNIEVAMSYLLRVASRRSVVFLISDFMDSKFYQTLKIANKKHDMVGIQIYDPSEQDIPDVGLVKVHDAETEETFWLDSTSSQARKEYRDMIEQKDIEFQNECRKMNFDLIPISTEEDYVEPLMSYFRSRERRF